MIRCHAINNGMRPGRVIGDDAAHRGAFRGSRIRTEHQAVVTAMDAAAKLGVSQLSIATTQATGKQ